MAFVAKRGAGNGHSTAGREEEPYFHLSETNFLECLLVHVRRVSDRCLTFCPTQLIDM